MKTVKHVHKINVNNANNITILMMKINVYIRKIGYALKEIVLMNLQISVEDVQL